MVTINKVSYIKVSYYYFFILVTFILGCSHPDTPKTIVDTNNNTSSKSDTIKETNDKESLLKGLSGITIEITDIEKAYPTLKLDSEVLRTNIELNLRRAGIHILAVNRQPSGKYIIDKNQTTLFIDLNITKASGLLLASVEVNLFEPAILKRNNRAISGLIWKRGISESMLSKGSKSEIETLLNRIVEQVLNEFTNEYLAANQK